MTLKAQRFPALLKAVDKVNMPIVLFSIVGLILEYTPLRAMFPPMITVNKFVDAYFVFDFIVRMLCLPSKKYFLKGYGWVDLLASIPGISLIFQANLGFLAMLKITRIGRFFKIIRILRFLRIFSFLKKMKSDSAFIQERIMKIGVTIVLVFVVGIAISDIMLKSELTDSMNDKYNQLYRSMGFDIRALVSQQSDVVYYTSDGKIFSPADHEDVSGSSKHYDSLLNSEGMWYIEVPLNEGRFRLSERDYPETGLLVKAETVTKAHDSIMLVLILTLIFLIVIIIFYIGYIFAKDMRVVQLIVDSIDADDYMLLLEEAKTYTKDGVTFKVEESEDEIESLIKMTAKLVRIKEKISGEETIGISMPFGLTGEADDIISEDEIAAAGEGLAMLGEDDVDFDEASTESDEMEDAVDLENEMDDVDIPDIDDDVFIDDDEAEMLKEELDRKDESLSSDNFASSMSLDDSEDNSSMSPASSAMDSSKIKEIIDEAFEEKMLLSRKEILRVSEESAMEAVKIATKSIVEYINKHLK